MLISERAPVLLSLIVAPSVSALSSITNSLCASAISRMRSQSGRLPIRDGIITAFVFLVIIRSIASTSIL
ncbi:hypothetical protein D3C71_2126660 [compost metagenome]